MAPPDFCNLVVAHCQLAESHSALGNYDAAVAEFKLALQIEPEHMPSLFNLALTTGCMMDLEGSVRQFEHMSSVDIDEISSVEQSARCSENIGEMWERAGNIELAVAAFNQAIAEGPPVCICMAAHTHALTTRCSLTCPFTTTLPSSWAKRKHIRAVL
jgi:tetratricopeptide (TPR) repeat protein